MIHIEGYIKLQLYIDIEANYYDYMYFWLAVKDIKCTSINNLYKKFISNEYQSFITKDYAVGYVIDCCCL